MKSCGVEWIIELDVEPQAVDAAGSALDDLCSAVSSFESTDGSGLWRITGYAAERPRADAVAGRLAVAGVAAGVDLPAARIERLPETDWLAENRRSFTPVRAGRYLVLPLHDETVPTPGSVVIRLNAGPAFGSGTHESTRGCLLALAALARREPVQRVLDLGTGSGILAIAAARTWPCEVLATDIDPVAVATAMENAARNGVADHVRAVPGPGLLPVARRGRFDLVLANIQARPLRELARSVAGHCALGAHLVLSGVLAEQEASVLARYRAAGFRLGARIPLGAWVTLVMRYRRSGSLPAVHSPPDFG